VFVFPAAVFVAFVVGIPDLLFLRYGWHRRRYCSPLLASWLLR
jgi:hypothetical protein